MKKIYFQIRKSFSFIQIDYSFVLLLVLAFLLDSVRVYFLYVLFIILHELSHMLVARKLGYLPEKLKLTMFGASLEGFDDFLLLDEIKIVLAGPLFNLFVIVCCYLSFWFYPESFEFLNNVLVVNQSILFFNLLPIFPLDAGRILLCFASVKKGRKEGLQFIKKLSFVFVLFLFVLSIFSFFYLFNFALGFASINLCILLFESSRGTSFKREIIFRKKIESLKKGITQKRVYVLEGYSKARLLKFIDGEHYFIFIFVDEFFQIKSQIDECQLLKELGFI